MKIEIIEKVKLKMKGEGKGSLEIVLKLNKHDDPEKLENLNNDITKVLKKYRIYQNTTLIDTQDSRLIVEIMKTLRSLQSDFGSTYRGTQYAKKELQLKPWRAILFYNLSFLL